MLLDHKTSPMKARFRPWFSLSPTQHKLNLTSTQLNLKLNLNSTSIQYGCDINATQSCLNISIPNIYLTMCRNTYKYCGKAKITKTTAKAQAINYLVCANGILSKLWSTSSISQLNCKNKLKLYKGCCILS